MTKLCVLCPRKPDLTLEQFEDHWRNIHGPLFSSQPEVRQYVKKYVQVHSSGEQAKGDFPSVSHYDGIAEIWFDTVEDIPKVFESDNFKTIIAQDEAKFIDRPNVRWIYATENVVIGQD